MQKTIALILITAMAFLSGLPSGQAAPTERNLTRGAASLLVPGVGQYINGELETRQGKLKTGAMVLLEVGAIVTTAVVGGVVGYPQIWAGISIFLFNHIWSATDAYINTPAGPEVSLKEDVVSDR